MKKISMLMAVVAAIVLSSCGSKDSRSKVDLSLKTDVDTLSYAMGLLYSQGAMDYAVRAMQLDTTYFDDYVQGIIDGVKSDRSPKTKAYATGFMMAQQVNYQMLGQANYQLTGNDSTKVVNVDNFLSGFFSGLKEKYPVFTRDSAIVVYERLMETVGNRMKAESDSLQALQNADNKAAGEAFMAEIAQKEGIQTVGDGIYYEVLTEGNGEIPAADSKVKVNYEGKLIDGTVFDSSYNRGEPATFPCNAVIQGWTKVLTNMPVGSTWMVYIPQEQAYGEGSAGALIKPYSCLQFKIELLEIVKPEEEK